MSHALIQEVEDDSAPPTTLDLTPVEATLRRLLLDVAKYIQQSPPPSEAESQVKLPEQLANEPIILRFTGGWVRDKLLGVPSHDIDVAVNKMTGFQYGLRLKEYLQIPGNAERYGLEGVATSEKQSQKASATDKSKTVGGLHKIEANPEKSKHLETVTTRILGLDVDLVNLRKETYSDDSRNPQMEFGTPKEDALRRDATVNAMFYNINEETIEDFTGRGHEDMRQKIIRTPLEPYQTFKDDPLRVLRLIRFASRLGYTIDPEALDAMGNVDIKDALRRKISRERVGKELEKALQGPNPHEALRLVFNLDLYETIFSDPSVETADHYAPDTDGWKLMIDTLQEVIQNGGNMAEVLIRDAEEQYMAWQLSALVPYRDAPQPEPPPGRKAPPPIAAQVAREGIKATNKVSDVVAAAVRNRHEISEAVDRLYELKRRSHKPLEGDDPAARDVLGMAIRGWGSTWRSQVIYAFLVDVVENPGSVEATQRKYTTFTTHLNDLSLLDVCTLKPLLDGKTLAKALDTSPGPWMKDALDVVMAWQLRNPSVTDPSEAIEEVRRKRGELSSSLVRHFLTLTIRPLFAKTRPSNVTAAGRKVQTEVLPKRIGMEPNEDITKPWKSGKEAQGLKLFSWVVSTLDERLVEEVWPMIVPPVLTLVDDWDPKYKRMGAQFLRQLLAVTPPLLLERTGLGEVFEGALTPALTNVPTIVPEDESVKLLSAVYPALLTLAQVSYPKNSPAGSKRSSSDIQRERTKYFDRILREGILQGYDIAGQYPRVVTLLFQELVPVLNELGSESIKHLMYVLPMLTGILSHSASTGHPPLLFADIQALQTVIRTCWPRMTEWKGEVLKGLTICWLQAYRLESEDAQMLRQGLRDTARLLHAAFGDAGSWEEDCAKLIGADDRVKDLLMIG